MCPTCIAHDGGNIGKVLVDHDVIGIAHQLGNGADCLLEHIVGNAKGIDEGDFLIGNVLQPVVGDDNQGIHLVGQSGNAVLCLRHTAGALKLKGLGDNTNGQRTGLPGDVGNNGSCAGAGAAAHACGDEHHVGVLQHLGNGCAALFCGLLSDFGLGAGAHTAGELFADLNLFGSLGLVEVLTVGIHCNKINALYTGLDHAVDNIVARAANADDFNGDNSLGIGFAHKLIPPKYLYSAHFAPQMATLLLFYRESTLRSIEILRIFRNFMSMGETQPARRRKS